MAKHLHLTSTRNVDARKSTSRREPQTLVMILVKAPQKAPLRASVNVGSLHKSSSLIDLEGRLNLSKGYQQERKTVRIAKHTLAAAVSSGDMFTNWAVGQIHKEATTQPRAEHMQREDFEPPTREFMQQCALGPNGRPESKRNSVPLRSMRYGGSKHHLQVPRYCHSSGYTESSETGWEK